MWEVLGLLSVLTSKIAESKAVLSAQGIGNALYNLQNMSSDSVEVLKLQLLN